MRNEFVAVSILLLIGIGIGGIWVPWFWWLYAVVALPIGMGTYDYLQTSHTIRRNFPLLGRARYLFEAIRPEINQYFVESNSEGRPFSREQRSLVYQRAKGVLDTLPFGTQHDVYEVGYEWINHSIVPTHPHQADLRIAVGGPDCKQIYNASILNISAMSYGSLSSNAICALNSGAKIGGFAHNTGEGGLSPFHKSGGGDLIWQIGTGYFGCRTLEGDFDAGKFRENATLEQVKMIEIKISQGAKPGHGGILPAAKVSPEIAAIRHVPMGKDVISPPGHSAFSTPIELLQFIAKLRDLSGGKPVGIKLCIGKRREFFAICKAMQKTGILPDYVAVDGGEGGTGAAPLEFSNFIGSPLTEGLIFVHNALVGFGVRDKIKVFAGGKVVGGMGMIKRLALGADAIYCARGFMLALGCIQALKCNSNDCPTGVATQDPKLVAGLVVTQKKLRVARFHEETLESVAHMIGAMGFQHTQELRPWHIMRRTSITDVHNYGELYDHLKPGELLQSDLPPSYARAMRAASAETFQHMEV